jgi:hypothetical protein
MDKCTGTALLILHTTFHLPSISITADNRIFHSLLPVPVLSLTFSLLQLHFTSLLDFSCLQVHHSTHTVPALEISAGEDRADRVLQADSPAVVHLSGILQLGHHQEGHQVTGRRHQDDLIKSW